MIKRVGRDEPNYRDDLCKVLQYVGEESAPYSSLVVHCKVGSSFVEERLNP